MTKIKRITKHLLTTHRQINKCFPPETLDAIEQTIGASEALHAGEIRFVVEAALDGIPLFQHQTAQARAVDVFSQLRIWDTEYNSGLLIYVLLADHAVEIIADRGVHAKVGSEEWQKICRSMENDFKKSNFKEGVISGINAVTQHLLTHFPVLSDDTNELSNKPVILR